MPSDISIRGTGLKTSQTGQRSDLGEAQPVVDVLVCLLAVCLLTVCLQYTAKAKLR